MPEAPRRACPICGKPAGEAFRPFCSRRCADVDLNRWVSGVYAVPVTEDEEEDERREDSAARLEPYRRCSGHRKSSNYNRGLAQALSASLPRERGPR